MGTEEYNNDVNSYCTIIYFAILIANIAIYEIVRSHILQFLLQYMKLHYYHAISKLFKYSHRRCNGITIRICHQIKQWWSVLRPVSSSFLRKLSSCSPSPLPSFRSASLFPKNSMPRDFLVDPFLLVSNFVSTWKLLRNDIAISLQTSFPSVIEWIPWLFDSINRRYHFRFLSISVMDHLMISFP